MMGHVPPVRICTYLGLKFPLGLHCPQAESGGAMVTGQPALTQRYEYHEGEKVRIQFIVV